MRLVLGLLALLCALPAMALDEAVPGAPDSGAAYQHIEALRAQEMADFKSREAACNARFAVNDCLKKLQPAHRAVLADLQRQETRLHDSERAQRGAEQLQRAEQKQLESMQAAEQAATAAAEAEGKAQAQRQKQAEHAASAASVAAPSGTSPSGPAAAEQSANAKAYAAKQAAAVKKRQEVAKRLEDKQNGKPVAPLPVPP